MMRRFSRRDMLKITGAALATGLAPNLHAQGSPSAVVIGAGIAGLSAAYDLQQAGFAVTVMEKANFTGGRMRNDWVGPIYTTPHALGVLQGTKEIFSLADDLGIKEEFAGASETDAYMIDNGHGQYQVSLKFDLQQALEIPGLTSETRRKLMALKPELEKFKAEVDPAFCVTGAQYDDETVEEYFNRILGPEAAAQFMDYWVDTFLDPWGLTRDTSCAPVMANISSGQSFSAPRGGIGVLTRKLGELLHVQNKTTVRYITPPNAEGRHTIHYLTSNFQRKSVTPDVVVLAVEGKFVPELVQGLDEQETRYFKSIDFAKIVRVAFVLNEKANPTEPQGMAFIPRHPSAIGRKVWFWHTAAAGTEHPDNPPRIYVDLHRSPENIGQWQASGKSQPDYCLALLQELYPEFDATSIVDAVNFGSDELAYMPKGFIRATAAMLNKQEKTKRGLYYAGEYLAGSHTAAASASGRTTARTIIKHWI